MEEQVLNTNNSKKIKKTLVVIGCVISVLGVVLFLVAFLDPSLGSPMILLVALIFLAVGAKFIAGGLRDSKLRLSKVFNVLFYVVLLTVLALFFL
jgi:hypothetical protein